MVSLLIIPKESKKKKEKKNVKQNVLKTKSSVTKLFLNEFT